MKGGNDTVEYDAWIRGGITFNGGGGTNELAINSNAWIGGSIRYLSPIAAVNDDNLTIVGSNIVIGRNIIADFGEGTSWTTFGGGVIGGKVGITGGAGADTIASTGWTLARGLTAALGDGDNFVGIESQNGNVFSSETSFFGGALNVTTGNGTDTIEIGQENNVYVLGAVTLATGNEASGGDTVLIDNTKFSSSVWIDLGGGDDIALFETVDNLNASTDIGGVLTVLGRAGNDTVAFAQVGGARIVDLAQPPTLGGGSGNDLLVVVNLSVDGTDVNALPDLGSTPLNFESILI